MNTITSTRIREGLTFAGLLALTMLASVIFTADPALASSLLNTSDAPSIITNATGGQGDAKVLILQIINYFLGFLGVVAVIMVIYAGVLYVTSAGNDESVGKAKKIMLYAGVGLLLVFISFALVNTILGAVTSSSSTTTTL